MKKKVSSESIFKDIRRRTPTKYSSEEKIRIVLEGMRGEESGEGRGIQNTDDGGWQERMLQSPNA
jgi:transposase